MCGDSGNPRTLFFSNPDAKASSLSIKLFGDQNCNNLVGGGGGKVSWPLVHMLFETCFADVHCIVCFRFLNTVK